MKSSIFFLHFLLLFSFLSHGQIQLFQMNEAKPILTGECFSFQGGPQDFSGSQGTTYAFGHNTDSLYVARFAPFAASNDEPMLVYVKCYFPGAVFSNSSQVYDNFNPNFNGIGGINFAAYIKPTYDESRFWNGTTWSPPNTNLKPFYKKTTNLGARFEVAIPWSAMIPAGGIPDSVKIVIYQTNGNSAGIFSYAQLPKTLPAGAEAAPSITTSYQRKIKNIISEDNPYNFGRVSAPGIAVNELFVYNSGTTNVAVFDASFSTWLPTAEANAFSIFMQPSSPIPPKKTSKIQIEVAPNTPLTTYSALGYIFNGSIFPNYGFRVVASAVGSPDISVTYGSGNIASPSESISFGEEIPENTAVEIDLNVASTGQDTLNIGPTISSNPSDFQVVSTSATDIPPGQSATVKIRFLPNPAGSYTGKLNMGANLSENSYRIDLSANVVPTVVTGIMEVYQVPNRPIKVDGNTETQWLPSEKISSGTTGLDWFMRWTPDTLYLARTGGNNAEPQLIHIRASHNEQPDFIAQSPTYDGVSTNFPTQSGINFIAYLKNNYDEYRTADSGSWSAANTALVPRYGSSSGLDQMEVAIPWTAISNGNGIPDSLKLVLFQTNGNSGSPFVYGQVPSSITGGAVSNVQATASLRKTILSKLFENISFDFGSRQIGTQTDTTFIAYNKGNGPITEANPFSITDPDFQVLTTQSSTIQPKKYSAFKVRFAPITAGPKSVFPESLYSDGTNLQTYIFSMEGNGTGAPSSNIQISSGPTVFSNGDTLKFGNLDIGTQKDSTLWVKNTGNDTLRITNPLITGPGFSIVNVVPQKLAIGDSAQIRIRFFSSIPAGTKTGTFTLTLNVPNLPSFQIKVSGLSTQPVPVPSRLEIRHIANNVINTSGAIPASQLQQRFLLSDNGGIKWYATWDTAHLYVVKIGGNRAQPQILYIKANYPGAVFTDTPTFYDGFHPNFTGIGGVNFSAYLKETAVPYDEFRTWNGTLWSAPDPTLLPLYGNQGNGDVVALRIPWSNITQGNGIPDSIKLALYQTNGNPGGFFAYGQSPTSLPSGNIVMPPVNSSHNFKIITRLPRNAVFNFGNVVTGSSVDTTFLLQNEGAAGSVVTINGPATLSGTAYSSPLQTVAGTTVASKRWTAVKVRFSPTGLGTSTGSLTANASFDQPVSPYSISFTGTGVAQPQSGIVVKLGKLSVLNGGNVTLGLQEIGTQTDTSVTVINSGSDTLRINGIGGLSPGWSLVSFPAPKIVPGDSTKFKVRKDVVTPGVNFGQFSFGTNAPGNATFNFSIFFTGDSALTWFPPNPTINDSITITLNPAFGNQALKDTQRVYIHSGVITSGPTGTAWSNIQGTFTVPADSVKMQNIGPNKQQIKFRIRDFYNLTGTPTVHRLGMVFRNGTGTKVGKTRSDGDFFIPVNPNPATAQIRVRTSSGVVLTNGDTIQFGTLPYGTVRDTSVTIKNTGVVPLNFSLINVSGFSYNEVGTAPTNVAVGDSITVNIQLNVNGEGTLVGFLNLLSNASNSPSLLINLLASGVVSNKTLEETDRFHVSPNPTSGKLLPSFGDPVSEARYQIQDMAGRTLEQGNWKSGEVIDVSNLPTGILILTMETKQGSIVRQKIVKD